MSGGGFPAILSLITLFLVGGLTGPAAGVIGALMLTGVLMLGTAMTLLTSRLLSATLLKGTPSSFALELPPYRRPQVGRVILRSILDRTVRVLGRAVVSATPAGLLLWVLANVSPGGVTLLTRLTGLLDPLGRLLGMDGTILTGFLLGFPANEIVIPIMLMAYTAQGILSGAEGLQLLAVLTENGWTWVTAVCTILFFLMHWPCATTCLTVFRETRSLKWTAAAFLLPTLCGMLICFVFSGMMSLFL